MKARFHLSVSLIILVVAAATAEGANVPRGYRVVRDTYSIAGRTRETSVRARVGSAEGMTFPTKEELDGFAAARAQLLENMRAFKKSSVLVEIPTGYAPDDEGFIPAELVTRIEDGPKFIPIPYAFYNSNDGFMTGAIANAPNLSGTLENLTAIGLYTAPPGDGNALQWTDPNFTLIVALSGIRTGALELGLTAGAMRMNEKTVDRGEKMAEFSDPKGFVGAAVSWEIAERVKNSVKFRLSGSPSNDLAIVEDPDYLSYGPFDWSIDAEESVTRDAVDWKGNFREGSKATIRAKYAIAKPSYDERTKTLSGGAEYARFIRVDDRFNPSFRVGAEANSGFPDLKIGRNVRGIRNSSIKGNADAYANLSVQTSLFRLGHAEFHCSPVADAIVAYVPDDPDYEWDWGLTAGGELLVFLDSVKSLPIKLGFAYDLRPDSRVNDERFEIDFNFAVTY
jgi:hypothetical protein